MSYKSLGEIITGSQRYKSGSNFSHYHFTQLFSGAGRKVSKQALAEVKRDLVNDGHLVHKGNGVYAKPASTRALLTRKWV